MEGYNWNYKTFLFALLLIIPVIIQMSEGFDTRKNGPTGGQCTCGYCTKLRQKYEDKTKRDNAKFDFDLYNFNNKSNNDPDSFDGGDLELLGTCPEFIDLWGGAEFATKVLDALKKNLDANGRMTRDNFNRVMQQFKGTSSESNNAKGAKPDDKDPESKDKKKDEKPKPKSKDPKKDEEPKTKGRKK